MSSDMHSWTKFHIPPTETDEVCWNRQADSQTMKWCLRTCEQGFKTQNHTAIMSIIRLHLHPHLLVSKREPLHSLPPQLLSSHGNGPSNSKYPRSSREILGSFASCVRCLLIHSCRGAYALVKQRHWAHNGP